MSAGARLSKIWFFESGSLRSVHESAASVDCQEAFINVLEDASPDMLGLLAAAHHEDYPSELEKKNLEKHNKEVLYFLVPQTLAKAGKYEGGMYEANKDVEEFIENESEGDDR